MKHWLVCYEYDSLNPTSSKRLINEVCKQDVGLWWAEKLQWYRNYEEEGRRIAKEAKERGEQVPLSERRYVSHLMLISAVEISEEAFERLKEML